MGRRRGQRGFDYQSWKPSPRKPPIQQWQPAIPAWEKEFCSTVGSVSWSRLLAAKKQMHLYRHVVEWNDSAGEEAFLNAKKRFWANMKRLSCEISLPDPNEYIDDIDWNPKIDPKLVLDME